MAISVYFIKQAKRRNSTYQFALTSAQRYDCALKAPTSLDRPTFLLSYSGTFDYNLCYFDGKYFFIDDVISVRDNQWEVRCVVDVLATYKSEIVASKFYVNYASIGDNTITYNEWLNDPRVPVSNDCDTALGTSIETPAFEPFDTTGFYLITVNGRNGCKSYRLSYNDLQNLLQSVDAWYKNDIVGDILSGVNVPTPYGWSTPEDAIKSLSSILSQSSVLGNAYSNAPSCILGCIWLPLSTSLFTATTAENIFLGEYDTGVVAYPVKDEKLFGQWRVSIPWYENDWRRIENTSLSLYLPFLGAVSLPVDMIGEDDELLVGVSISPVDGVLNYYIETDDDLNLLGSYKTSCASSYAIGLNQKASLSEVVQTVISGTQRAVNSVINSSLNPASIAAGVAGAVMEGVITDWERREVIASTHPTTIGSMGGSGVNFWIKPVTYVTHKPTSFVPTDLNYICGLPVMKPLVLSTLVDNTHVIYCQCVNAHCECAAEASELDAIDMFLNSGFYIE